MLVALLCVVVIALSALADASASRGGVSYRAQLPTAPVVSSAPDRQRPAAFVADRAMADPDNPFENGRLPLAGGAVSGPISVPSARVLMLEEGLASIDGPRPERPPRA